MTGWSAGHPETTGSAPNNALPSTRPVLLLLLACVVFAAWIATQVIAYKLGYHPKLGPIWYVAPAGAALRWRIGSVLLVIIALAIVIRARARRWTPAAAVFMLAGAVFAFWVSVGPIYTPVRGLIWAFRYDRVPAAAAVLNQGLWAFGAALVAALVLSFLARSKSSARAPSTSHGSAAWGTGDVFMQPRGLVLGRPLTPASKQRASKKISKNESIDASGLLRYGGDGHLLTVAPTRSGKGVGCVIPNLLTYPGSVVVTDPKGENYAVTARARRTLGQAVHAFDPFDVVDGTAAFNPLGIVDATSADAIDDARLLADMLVVSEGKGGADHAFWSEEARALLAGLILHVAANAPPALRTLPHVRELLTLPPEPFELVLQSMLESDAVGGLVSRAAARLLQKAARERSGVVSAAQSHTHFLDSPRMTRVLGSSTLTLEELKASRVSVYLVLPPDRMEGYHRWLRLMVACALRAATRVAGAPEDRVVFVLDEFAHLGRMQPVERDVGLVGGYGVTLWLLVQDLAQLRGTYPEKWQSFLANCDVLQAFGTADWDTAEYLSKMTGDATIHVASENQSAGVSHGQHAQRQQGAAFTRSEKGRRLLTPDEVLRLPRDQELLFLRGHAAVQAQRLDYRMDAMLSTLGDENPMHSAVNSSVYATSPVSESACIEAENTDMENGEESAA